MEVSFFCKISQINLLLLLKTAIFAYKQNHVITMRNIISLLIVFICTFSVAAAKKIAPNVVIESKEDIYKFIPSKDGSSLAKVEQTSQITFRANRVADSGVALVYYNDDTKIDKASGGTTVYGPYFSNDVFFSDSKACLINVDLKKGGAKGKASFKRTYTKPEFFCKVIIPELYDIENLTMTFEIPKSLSERFKIIEKNIEVDKMTRSEELKGDKLIISYHIKDISAPEFLSDAPSINVTSPQLLILGHYRNVDELYRYLRAYTLHEDPAAETVVAKAKEITASCTSDAERIAAITDFVHQTVRYVAVEHGEFGQRPDLASEVLRKAYGDCKCSATLIKAMLRAVGIDGRLVWVGTESIPEKWTDVPNVSSGDHMIAAAITGDSILFIDGTAKYNPAGTIPIGIQGQQAMIEDTPDKCLIATIPKAPVSENTRAERMITKIAENGDLISEGSITMTGAYFWSLKSLSADTPPAQRDEVYSKILAGILYGSHAKEASYTEYADSSVIIGKSVLSGAIKKAGTEIYVDLNPDTSLASLKFDTEDRKVNGQLGRIGALTSTITLLIPDNAEIADIPKDVTIDNQWISGSVTIQASVDGRSLTKSYQLVIKENDVMLADFEKFNTDIHRLNRACTAKLVLKSK